jgi:uncharacterized protein
MLCFDIRSLDIQALQVDNVLTADDAVWEQGDNKPDGDVRVTGRLSSAGSGRWYFSGRLEGQVRGECRRCLNEATAPVSDEAHFIYADQGAEEADDPDVYTINPRAATLDLRPAVREQWLLSAPALVLCREDCKGLCPVCGTDRNVSNCDCVPIADHRWDALRNVRTDSRKN